MFFNYLTLTTTYVGGFWVNAKNTLTQVNLVEYIKAFGSSLSFADFQTSIFVTYWYELREAVTGLTNYSFMVMGSCFMAHEVILAILVRRLKLSTRPSEFRPLLRL